MHSKQPYRNKAECADPLRGFCNNNASTGFGPPKPKDSASAS